jgi:hypothetical protein
VTVTFFAMAISNFFQIHLLTWTSDPSRRCSSISELTAVSRIYKSSILLRRERESLENQNDITAAYKSWVIGSTTLYSDADCQLKGGVVLCGIVQSYSKCIVQFRSVWCSLEKYS